MSSPTNPAPATSPVRWVRVWDPATRLFHWSLVLLVALNIYTGNIGGLREMDMHKLSGYAILALVLFRLVWGFISSRPPRFVNFVRGPRAVVHLCALTAWRCSPPSSSAIIRWGAGQ